MEERFSDEQIDQLKEAFRPLLEIQEERFGKRVEAGEERIVVSMLRKLEPMFVLIQQEFLKIAQEREKDRAEFREFREETNGHFESLEKRFQTQQTSIDDHSQLLGALQPKSI